MSVSAQELMVIAGGGTGGHIYPALGIARAIQEEAPHLRIEFVGTRRGLENTIVPREGYALHILPAGRLHSSVGRLERAMALVILPLALWRAFRLVRRLRPRAVIGVGGFASGPFVLMAALLGYPTFIWEANAVPGMANRWLSWFVDGAFVVFPEAQKQLRAPKFFPVGMPVRESLRQGLPEQSARLDKDFHVLVFGGSQGARAINHAIRDALMTEDPRLQGLKFVHQTGALDHAAISEAYRRRQPEAPGTVECFPYLHDMEARYAWADLIICRAGIATISEIAACGKAAILIPLPTAADDHQRKNAEVLVRAEAAMILLQSELSGARLLEIIDELRSQPNRLRSFADRVKAFHRPDAARDLARTVLAATAINPVESKLI